MSASLKTREKIPTNTVVAGLNNGVFWILNRSISEWPKMAVMLNLPTRL